MIWEIIKMAFESLLAKKTRSILSMLGIIIGVSTVIAVFAIGQGAQNAVDAQFQNLSANSIIVMAERGRGSTGSSKLTAGDAKTIMSQAQYVLEATPTVRGNASASFEKQSGSFTVQGVDENFFNISKLNLSSGRLLAAEDVSGRANVAVLGSDAADTLFPDRQPDPVGQTISVGGKRLLVIGVLEKVGSGFGPFSNDNALFVPYTTAETSIVGSRGQVMITVLATNVDTVSAASDEVTTILRAAHKLKATQADDFQIRDAGNIVSTAQDTAKMLTLLLTAIAAITLLVSGIGIMNVMFVTVAERTKEIGIAKAIGGKRSDILWQFLYESIILSMIGGLIGIAIGQGAIPILTRFSVISLASSWTGPIIGFSFSVLVGIFFGFYPALKASRLDPVDALRSE